MIQSSGRLSKDDIEIMGRDAKTNVNRVKKNRISWQTVLAVSVAVFLALVILSLAVVSFVRMEQVGVVVNTLAQDKGTDNVQQIVIQHSGGLAQDNLLEHGEGR